MDHITGQGYKAFLIEFPEGASFFLFAARAYKIERGFNERFSITGNFMLSILCNYDDGKIPTNVFLI
jgi:hypothetical protein